jgi:hypothetical protein
MITFLRNRLNAIRSKRMRISVVSFSFALIFVSLIAGAPIITHAGLLVKLVDSSLGNIFQGITYILLWFNSLILYVIGMFFDAVIARTVFGLGAFFGGNAGIIAGWTVLRDVANIGLLFGFIFLGITTILEIQQYEVKKTLPRLIIFAIFLNFSLLASQAIIDTSNVLSTVLYKNVDTSVGNGISSKVVAASGVSTILVKSESEGGGSGWDIVKGLASLTGPGMIYNAMTSSDSDDASNSKKGVIYLAESIFVIIVSVTLLAGALLLLTRAIILALLMVLSPIGFAAFAIPPLEKYGKMWWDKLLSQAFFAPIYLLLIFVGLKITSVATGGQAPGSISGVLNGDTTAFDVILIFALVSGFMIAALMAGKQFGMIGAQLATSWGMKAISSSLTYPFAWAGRNSLGRGASFLGKKFDAKIGQGVKDKKLWATALRTTGLDEVVAGGLTGVAGAKIGGFASYTERQKQAAEYKRVTDRAAKKQKLFDDIAKDPNSNEVKELLQQMSETEIEQSEIIQKGTDEQIKAIGKALSPEKFEQVMKNKEYTQEQKDKMVTARFADLSSIIEASAAGPGSLTPNQQAEIRNMSAKDLGSFAKSDASGFEKLLKADNADYESYLTEDQLEALSKNDSLVAAQKRLVHENNRTGRVEKNMSAGLTGRAQDLAKGMSGKQKAKMPKKMILSPDMIDTFDQRDLTALMEENKLSGAEVDAVTAQLRLMPPGPRRTAIENYFRDNVYARAHWGW